jgi:uncharacterized OsmC-like protein
VLGCGHGSNRPACGAGPLKAQYRTDPDAARTPLHASGDFRDDGITCTVDGWAGPVRSGLHRATGGDGSDACSGDLLLEALVACAGVTMKAVATALEIPLRQALVKAEGDLDFRGTLGVDRAAPVGFRAIRLSFELDTDAPQDKLDTLLKLTERYCVVFQSLNHRPELSVAATRTP